MDIEKFEAPAEVLPAAASIARARNAIVKTLPNTGLGPEKLSSHLQNDITPGFNNSSRSSRYYGFVTGGSTPAASFADNVVTQFDQNTAVHLPDQAITTDVEYHALRMLCELIQLDPQEWTHKIFTTGATGSNVTGLACAREYTVNEAAKRQGSSYSISKQGLLGAAQHIDAIQILAAAPHSSSKKAASIVGLGRDAVKDCSEDSAPFKLDVAKLKSALATPRTASIILVACCEVNAGMFATQSYAEMQQLRRLADQYGAWIHIDAAMGFMARVLPSTPEYAALKAGVEGLELADSITGDGHKLLNVPYDTGFLLSRHVDVAMRVFQNPGATYLATAECDIPSPLHIGLENSRRFRALPVYANLVAYGRDGYRDSLERQVGLARTVAGFLFDSPDYDLYQPRLGMTREEVLAGVFMILLFRAKDKTVNATLVQRINATRKIQVTGSRWEEKPATRIAVSHWAASTERDWPVIKEVLGEVVKQ